MWSRQVVRVTSAYYLDSCCHTTFTAKSECSFHCICFLANIHIMPFIRSIKWLLTVMTWCTVTVCHFDIHRVHYRNGLNTSMMYLTILHSSCGAKTGQQSFYDGYLSYWRVNCCTQVSHWSNSSVEVHFIFTSITSSTAIHLFACWESMNAFRQPGVNVFNTISFPCYMNVRVRWFKMSWNADLFNDLCQTWSHWCHLLDSSIALFSWPLTLPNVLAFLLSNLLITLMGFLSIGAAHHPETADERK
jgi:hypothetical protein